MNAQSLIRSAALCAILALVAGCGSKKSPAAPQITQVVISLAANCPVCQATGGIFAISGDWASNRITLKPGSSVTVDVPSGGAYSVYFEALKECDDWVPTIMWDFAINADAGRTTPAAMTCNR